MALLDADERQVVLLSLGDGRERRAGRRGSGPGEFELPVALLAREDGSMLVADGRTLRVTELAPDLRYVRSQATPGMPLHLLAWNGGAVLGVWIGFGGGGPEVGRVDMRTGAARRLFDPFRASSALVEGAAGIGGPSAFVAAVRAADGRIVMGGGSRYALLAFDTAGADRGSFGRPDLVPEPMSAAELDEMRQRMGRIFQGAVPPGEQRRLLERVAARPRPFFRANALAADAAGRLWVATERGEGSRTYVDVFDASGRLRGTVVLRDRVKKLAVRGALIAALVERRGGDGEGGQGVDVYRVDVP